MTTSDAAPGARFEALRSSVNHEWATPREIFDPLHAEFGFTIDAAASVENALLPRFWAAEDDALHQNWDDEIAWCNPPYGRTQIHFIRKAFESKGTSVLLIPARPDTRIWHECIHKIAEVRFVPGRIRFVGAEHAAPFPSAIVVWRKGCDRTPRVTRRAIVKAAAAHATGEVLPFHRPRNTAGFRQLPQAKRAANAGVSRDTIQKLDHLARHHPDLHAQVAAGQISVDAAYRDSRRGPREARAMC